MDESRDPPTERTMLLTTVVDLLEKEFPGVNRSTLGGIFLTCKWRLQEGEPFTKAFEEARRLLAEHPDDARKQIR